MHVVIRSDIQFTRYDPRLNIDSQCTYNGTLWHVRANIVDCGKSFNYYIF
jgi:hypothetical protein